MAAETRFLDDDIIRIPLYKPDALPPDGKKLDLITLFWGDQVRITGKHGGQQLAEFPRREWNGEKKRYETINYVGLLPKKTTFRDSSVLKVRFVDVGQGDGAMVETPKGQVLFIDGGEEEHMRRYVNVAFSHILRTKPLHCDAIIVTHGDADHFAGLTKLVSGFRSKQGNTALVTADRVFHNGLVKVANASGKTAFGKTAELDGKTYAIELEDDLRTVDPGRMNKPFKDWQTALIGLKTRDGKKPRIQRLEYGDDDAFDFLEPEGVGMKVLGPITEDVRGKPGLRFLKTPGSSSVSASHTVNGHSIVLKLTYGNVRFLFGADLNEESEESLLERSREDNVSLASEILKVPHHGSADFSPRILEAIRPVVSVVSSGDENATKEYIHPRSGLIGALGRYSRGTVDKPLIYVTEMVAFFQRMGNLKLTPVTEAGNDGKPLNNGLPMNNMYRKTQFGIVHVRTDGQRVLVATHSGKVDQKESYSFTVDERGDVKFLEKARIV